MKIILTIVETIKNMIAILSDPNLMSFIIASSEARQIISPMIQFVKVKNQLTMNPMPINIPIISITLI
jgi:hypothetical protein